MENIRIIKIGGSLLSTNDYVSNVLRYVNQLTNDLNIFICGGGPPVQRIREAQRQFNLSEAECHHNSLVAMDRNTRNFCWQADIPVIKSWQSVAGYTQNRGAPICSIGLEVTSFVMQDEHQFPPPHLPENWDTTSDSIAARITTLLDASLDLLKSTPPATTDLLHLSKQGYIDRHFPIAAANINSLRFVDLSD